MKPQNIPILLIILRAILGPVMIITGLLGLKNAGLICVILLAIGVLSDIFDGVLARKFNVVTDNLRLWDSRVDVIFWVCTAIALHILYPTLWDSRVDVIFWVCTAIALHILYPTLWHISWVMIIVLGIMETIPRIISHIRFKREASTHHILSKIFTLFLWATISLAFLNGELGNLYWLTLLIGIISQLEAIAIMLIIPKWAVDVKSIKSAWEMRTDFILGNKYP